METIVLADMQQLRKRVSEKLEEEHHPYTNSPDLFEALKKLRLKGMAERMSSSAFQANNVDVVSMSIRCILIGIYYTFYVRLVFNINMKFKDKEREKKTIDSY